MTIQVFRLFDQEALGRPLERSIKGPDRGLALLFGASGNRVPCFPSACPFVNTHRTPPAGRVCQPDPPRHSESRFRTVLPLAPLCLGPTDATLASPRDYAFGASMNCRGLRIRTPPWVLSVRGSRTRQLNRALGQALNTARFSDSYSFAPFTRNRAPLPRVLTAALRVRLSSPPAASAFPDGELEVRLGASIHFVVGSHRFEQDGLLCSMPNKLKHDAQIVSGGAGPRFRQFPL